MKNLSVLIAMLCALNVHAQLKEDFETNGWGWNEYVSKRSSALVKEGKMCLESYIDEPALTFCYAPLDVSANFEVRCDVLLKKISDDKTFGLVVDYQDDDNYIAFMVTEGLARFERWKEGRLVGRYYNQIKLKEQRKSVVTLSLKAEYQRLVFLVNDMKALERRYQPLESCGIGFKAGGKQKVEFDNLEILQ